MVANPQLVGAECLSDASRMGRVRAAVNLLDERASICIWPLMQPKSIQRAARDLGRSRERFPTGFVVLDNLVQVLEGVGLIQNALELGALSGKSGMGGRSQVLVDDYGTRGRRPGSPSFNMTVEEGSCTLATLVWFRLRARPYSTVVYSRFPI
jgi:hypothetical protein